MENSPQAFSTILQDSFIAIARLNLRFRKNACDLCLPP